MPPVPDDSNHSLDAPPLDPSTFATRDEVKKMFYKHEPLSKEKLSWEVNLISFPILVAILAVLPPRIRLCVVLVVALDCAVYYARKRSMAGIPYTLPFVSLLAVVIKPVRFWDEQAAVAIESGDGMSTNTLLGNFMVYITDTKLSREVLTGEGIYSLYVHPNAWWLLGSQNLVYMKTEPHKRFRKLLSPALFSQDALRHYAEAHEAVARRHLARMKDKCAATGEPVDVRLEFRRMAVSASQESFLGPYLTDETRSFLENEILIFMMGFLCFPFPYFNTGLAKAIQARKNILVHLERIVAEARENALTRPPQCLLDYWEKEIVLEGKKNNVDPQTIEGSSDEEVASSILDFLFAAQDATNSALSFTIDVLDARPDVVRRIHNEVHDTLRSDLGASIWSKMSDSTELLYTKRAVNQLLHHKPPVPMIPHIANKNVTLGGHFIPKGTIVIPSLVEAGRTSGMSRIYDPDTPDQDTQFVKTITFGGGQHKCAGRRYAERLLGVFVSVLVTEYDFERVGPRPETLDIMYFPTLFPSQNKFVVSSKSGDF